MTDKPMFTVSNTGITFLQATKLGHILFVVPLLILFNFETEAQKSARFELENRYNKIIRQYLLSEIDEKDDGQMICLLVKPSQSYPEYSVCLFGSTDSSRMVVTAFKTSVTDQLMRNFILNTPDNVLSLDTIRHSLTLKGDLSKRLKATVVQFLTAPGAEELVPTRPLLDGTSYVFIVFGDDHPREINLHEAGLTAVQAELIRLFARIAEGVQKDTFNEHEISKRLEELQTTQSKSSNPNKKMP